MAIPTGRSRVVLRCLVVVTVISIVVYGLERRVQTDETEIDRPTKTSSARGLASLSNQVNASSLSSSAEEAVSKEFNDESPASGDGVQTTTETEVPVSSFADSTSDELSEQEGSKPVEPTTGLVLNEKLNAEGSHKEEPPIESNLSDTSTSTTPEHTTTFVDDPGSNESSVSPEKSNTKSIGSSSKGFSSQISPGDIISSPTSDLGVIDSSTGIDPGTDDHVTRENGDKDQESSSMGGEHNDATEHKNEDQENNVNHSGSDTSNGNQNEIVTSTATPAKSNLDRNDNTPTLVSSASSGIGSSLSKWDNGSGNDDANGNANESINSNAKNNRAKANSEYVEQWQRYRRDREQFDYRRDREQFEYVDR
ncbi:hypothetical protein PPTG_11040 [Phytophthora nicotianae INRA-310]|uniref:Uncharacterized protein n=1 Tax=Phytophthora nicotianae (strain INRA-310) TaxID=761204 RepID=W2Q738_PHYN3|nr:hypothetical protein PPTG_11040 [Phytophthora nicotianae INRA-310]ETN08972.1 hypothetical protein PPTG_11040 [Phytophthora nicotianae INRA-310]